MKNPENKISEFEEQCLEWFNNDSIGRNQELFDFINYLNDSDDDIASIFLDSDWGRGKTVFIKQAELLIRFKNEKLISPDYVIENKNNISDMPLFPVYYNAWENDAFDDPLASILASISLQADVKFKKSLNLSISRVLTKSVDFALASYGLPAVASNLKNCVSWNSYLKDYEKFRKLNVAISNFLDNVQEKTNTRIVLFIDELDRCRPSFALKLLETIKNKFLNKNFLVVYAINTNELSNTVQKFYGNNIDGHKYLQKFYDYKILLNEIDADKYITLFKIGDSKEYRSHAIAIELSNYMRLSMRQLNSYFPLIEEFDKLVFRTSISASMIDFLKFVALPILACIKLSRPLAYSKIKTEYDTILISEIVNNCINVKAGLFQFFKEMNPQRDDEPADDWIIVRFKELLYFLFMPVSNGKWKSAYDNFSKYYLDVSPNYRSQLERYL